MLRGMTTLFSIEIPILDSSITFSPLFPPFLCCIVQVDRTTLHDFIECARINMNAFIVTPYLRRSVDTAATMRRFGEANNNNKDYMIGLILCVETNACRLIFLPPTHVALVVWVLVRRTLLLGILTYFTTTYGYFSRRRSSSLSCAVGI